MHPYTAPVDDMRFVLNNLIGLERLSSLPGFDMVSDDLIDAVLDQAGKLASDIIAPLNWAGDQEACVLENGVVRTPKGFREAYQQYVEGGWNSLPFDPTYGGQGMPWAVAFPVQEMIHASNMAFGLCPLLTVGAVDLLSEHGSDEQKATYLEKMITGEWTGTMNLTEPQAGSDLSQVRTKAVPDGDHYRITGQKIYITYGEHDMTDNIIHMVLARLPDAPEGTKGISLFIVPKFLVNPDGSLGQRNDARCVSIEHKLGIKASPTAVMSFGDTDGAIGYLVGEPNKGLSYMFTMMNNARLLVGLEGVAIAERAYQQARDYALDRVQSKAVSGSDGPVAIIKHPDVRRMLLDARAKIEAGRGLAYLAAYYLDVSKVREGTPEGDDGQAMVDLLTPVVKAWCTDMALDVTSSCVQVHGGMGFIEETGAAQHYRDARILPIYEGTNGIQANDLVFRKVIRDGGKSANAFIRDINDTIEALGGKPGDDAASIAEALNDGVKALQEAVDWVVSQAKEPDNAAAAATPFCKLFGTVAGGYVLAKSALAAMDGLSAGANGHGAFFDAKVVTAVHYADQIMPLAASYVRPVKRGYKAILSFDEAAF